MIINLHLKTILLITTILFFAYIIYMIRKKKLSLKYSLTWFLASFVLIILAMFDYLAIGLAKFLQIETPLNAIVVAVFAFVLLILFTLTITISKNSEKIRILTQELALLKKDVEELNLNSKSEQIKHN